MLSWNTRVLIVDDMPAMRVLISDMLGQLGFREILEAEDGESAWQLVRSQISEDLAAGRATSSIGLVVADWNMPGMSGVDLLRSLRSFVPTRNLPFLMVTGQRSREHLVEAFNAGVSELIVKPFDVQQLGEKIAKLMTPNE